MVGHGGPASPRPFHARRGLAGLVLLATLALVLAGASSPSDADAAVGTAAPLAPPLAA